MFSNQVSREKDIPKPLSDTALNTDSLFDSPYSLRTDLSTPVDCFSPSFDQAPNSSDIPPDNISLPPPTLVKSKKYFWEFVNFVVGEEEYQVPRFLFEGSPILELPTACGRPSHIVLDGISSGALDCLLSVMYPTVRRSAADFTLPLNEWQSVLKLSSRYKLHDVRDLAIKEMEASFLDTNSATFLSLGREFGIPSWIQSGAVNLVNSGDFLESDHKILGQGVTIHIYKLRERRLRNQIGYCGRPPTMAQAVETELSSELSTAEEYSKTFSRHFVAQCLELAGKKKKGKKGKKLEA